MDRRSKRLCESIKKEISNVIVNELDDPRISFITVVSVKLSSDLKNAKIYISILGNSTTQKTTIYGLRNARKFIQGQVARRLNIKYMPIISFHVDDSLKKMAHIDNLIAGINDEAAVDNDEAAVDNDDNIVDDD